MKKYLSTISNQFVFPALVGARTISLRHPKSTLIAAFKHFAQDSLYKNSIYLMLSTAIMSFFGFFFWIVNARLYSPEQIGIATTLISVAGLISGFSLLGLNVGLVRYLPHSENKNSKINSSFAISVIVSVLLSVIFLIGLNVFSPKLLFIKSNLFYIVTFILFVTALSLNALVESIFVAYRSAKYTLFKNSVLSIVKFILPVFLVVFSAYGIFTSVGVANVIAFILSVVLLVRNFSYKFKLEINMESVKKMSSFSFGNYLAGFIGGLPSLLLPIIIMNKLGSQSAAYFYIAMMIANLIFIIPQAITQSLFAEGVYDENRLINQLKQSIKIIYVILIPTIFMISLLGNYILLAFGKNYSDAGFRLMQLLSVSALLITITLIGDSILKIYSKIKELFILSVIKMLLILITCTLFIVWGLSGIGYAYLFSFFFMAAIYSILIYLIFKKSL